VRELVAAASLLLILFGCEGEIVFRDAFDDAPVGQPPAPPAVGTSSMSGLVSVVGDPINAASADRWLLLRQRSRRDLGRLTGSIHLTLLGEWSNAATFMLAAGAAF
jgi:hypothetical protein